MATRFAGLVRQFSTSAAARGKLVTAPLQVYGLEGRYAHALFSAASKEKNLEAVEKELKAVQDAMVKDPKINELILNPVVKKQDKSAFFQKSLAKGSSKITQNLIASLAENGRLKNMNSVINAYSKIMSAYRGEVTCNVTTAKPLEAANMKELQAILQGFVAKGETILLHTTVNPGILGGMIVEIGDKYVDMSTASKINTYSDLIKQAV